MELLTRNPFEGNDVSWLACDGSDALACLATNGSGAVPRELWRDPRAVASQQQALRAWMTRRGAALPLGAGATQSEDAAALGLWAYAWGGDAGAFLRIAVPATPARLSELPPDLWFAASQARLEHVRFAGSTQLDLDVTPPARRVALAPRDLVRT